MIKDTAPIRLVSEQTVCPNVPLESLQFMIQTYKRKLINEQINFSATVPPTSNFKAIENTVTCDFLLFYQGSAI